MSKCSNVNKNTSFLMQILTFIHKQNVLYLKNKNETQQNTVIVPFRLMTDGFVACCVIKMRENSLIASVNSFNGVNVIDVRTKWFRNFRRFELSRVNLSHGSQNQFELSGVSRNRGFEKSGMKLQSFEANPRETRFGSRYREVRETEGSRNRDSTVYRETARKHPGNNVIPVNPELYGLIKGHAGFM